MASCTANDAKKVSTIPNGFASLAELGNRADSILDHIFWETKISFLDSSDKVCIYQTYVGDRDFIAKYENEYYVDEAKYLELTDIAIIAREERQRTYEIGDTVEILGKNENYYVTIRGVEERIQDNIIICTIKYSITTDVSENHLKSIFGSVEATVGATRVTGNIFSFIDSETVRFEMGVDRKLEAIILKSPEYIGLTYRVIVN